MFSPGIPLLGYRIEISPSSYIRLCPFYIHSFMNLFSLFCVEIGGNAPIDENLYIYLEKSMRILTQSSDAYELVHICLEVEGSGNLVRSPGASSRRRKSFALLRMKTVKNSRFG
jgi:hypothetical protein